MSFPRSHRGGQGTTLGMHSPSAIALASPNRELRFLLLGRTDQCFIQRWYPQYNLLFYSTWLLCCKLHTQVMKRDTISIQCGNLIGSQAICSNALLFCPMKQQLVQTNAATSRPRKIPGLTQRAFCSLCAIPSHPLQALPGSSPPAHFYWVTCRQFQNLSVTFCLSLTEGIVWPTERMFGLLHKSRSAKELMPQE